jgi:hypothetical protein
MRGLKVLKGIPGIKEIDVNFCVVGTRRSSRRGKVQFLKKSVVLAMLLLTMTANARAEANPETEVGFRLWTNLWKREVPDAGRVTSDRAVLVGPEVSVRMNERLRLDAGYLLSASDYSFGGGATASEIERQDAEISIAYLFLPGFGLSAGYRSVWFTEKGSTLEETVYGPMVGIRGETFLSPDLMLLYGKADYQFTKFKQEEAGSTFRETSPGWIAELGLNLAVAPDFQARLGYKYEMNKGKDSHARDIFHGAVVAAFFIF